MQQQATFRGMILAAGLGTRLRPITDRIPKPCVPLLNIPLGLWPLQHLLEAGLTNLVVNTHHLPEQVMSLYQSQNAKLQTLNFSSEKPKILGSGGGVAKAKIYLDGDESFWLANGDEVFLPSQPNMFAGAWKQHLKNQPLATLLVMKHAEVGKKFGGVWVDKSGSVKGFGKQAPEPGLTGLHFTGFQIVSPRVFQHFPAGEVESNIFYDIYTRAIASGENVQIASVWGDWFETGSPSDLLAATRELLNIAATNKDLQKFLASHGAGELKKGFLIHPKSIIDPAAQLSGFVVAGKDSVVKGPVSLKNVVLLPGSQISSDVTHTLEESIL